jgi:hypothetical protein
VQVYLQQEQERQYCWFGNNAEHVQLAWWFLCLMSYEAAITATADTPALL